MHKHSYNDKHKIRWFSRMHMWEKINFLWIDAHVRKIMSQHTYYIIWKEVSSTGKKKKIHFIIFKIKIQPLKCEIKYLQKRIHRGPKLQKAILHEYQQTNSVIEGCSATRTSVISQKWEVVPLQIDKQWISC